MYNVQCPLEEMLERVEDRQTSKIYKLCSLGFIILYYFIFCGESHLAPAHIKGWYAVYMRGLMLIIYIYIYLKNSFTFLSAHVFYLPSLWLCSPPAWGLAFS